MTNGSSQGLFVVVAVVIFGIFVAIAYTLFEDNLKPALANMFTEATEQATMNLSSSFESVLTEPIWERASSNNVKIYPILREILTENGYRYIRITSPTHAESKILSVNIPFSGNDFSNKKLAGKKVKISLIYRTNAIGKNIKLSYFHYGYGENTVEKRVPLVENIVNDDMWQMMSKTIEFPFDINDGHSGYLFIHGGGMVDNYFDVKEVRFEILN